LVFNRPGGSMAFKNVEGDHISNEATGEVINEGLLSFLGALSFALLVDNRNVFSNTTSGRMIVDESVVGYISNIESQFTNQGIIDFKSNPDRGVALSVTNAVFVNSVDALFKVKGYSSHAINISGSGQVDNKGTMTMVGNGKNHTLRSVTMNNSSVLTNHAGATFEMSESTDGILVLQQTCRLNNFGDFSMLNMESGIVTGGIVLNRSGGWMKIANVSFGVETFTTGFFGNFGGAIHFIGIKKVDFYNKGLVRNAVCSKMYLDGQIIHAEGNFFNQGWLINTADGADHEANNALIINDGIIVDPYDRFGGALQNNKARIPAIVKPEANVPYPDALDIANTVNLVIAGFFLDQALTIPAGIYNQFSNTYTPNNAAIGATKLYAQTSVGASCSAVIPVRIEGGVQSIIGGGKEEVFWAKKEKISSIEIEAIKVFPNPTSSYVQVEIPPLPSATGELQLINAQGQIMLRQSINTEIPQTESFDLSEFPTGMYWMHLRNRDQVIAQEKIIVTH